MYSAIRAGKSAERFLMMGFTTVGNMGWPVYGLKRAVDEGMVIGLRIYLSGAYISQTSSQGDMRSTNQPSVALFGSQMHLSDAVLGWSFVVDGVPEVLKASRENLRKSAIQL